MQVSVEPMGGLKRRVFVTIPAEAVESRLGKRMNEVARMAKVDGFRPGKAPLALVKKQFGRVVRDEVLGDVMRESFGEAIKQTELRLAAAPMAMDAKPYVDTGAFSFTADVEVFPVINVVTLTGETLVKRTATLSDDDVTAAIDGVRKQHAKWHTVDRAAILEDKVIIDYKGTIDGEAFVGGSADGVPVVLGSKMMIPGFEDGLVGLKAGDHATLKLTFPADYNHADYAGKAAEFAVTVKQVEEAALPALDDAFIREFGLKESTEDALRAEVKKNLGRALKTSIKSRYKDAVVDRLLEKNVFDIPEVFVTEELRRLKKTTLEKFSQGRAMDDSLLDSLPDALYKTQAEKNVRFGLLLSAYIEHHPIDVDDARVNALIEEMAQTYDDPSAAVAWYSKHEQQREMIKGMALEDMALERLCEGATITETVVNYNELMG